MKIVKWCKNFLESQSLFDSRHVDDFIKNYSLKDDFSSCFKLFDLMIDTLLKEGKAEIIKPLLVFTLNESQTMDTNPVLKSLSKVRREWDNYTPPDLYLINREEDDNSIFEQEFKLPITLKFDSNYISNILIYYKCFRYKEAFENDWPEFSRALYFEYVP